MKKLLAILTVLAITLSISLTAFAAYERIDDKAGLLTEEEAAEVSAKLDEVSQKLGADVVVVTINDLEGKTEEEYADDYYESKLYASDGVLLLINAETGSGWISTQGEGTQAFTDYGIQQCADRIRPSLQSKDYAGAFSEFADVASEYFEKERAGNPVDQWIPDPEPEPTPIEERVTFGDVLITILIAFVIAFLISLIITAIMKSQMKSVIAEQNADRYVEGNRINITGSRDRFLYHTVQVIPLQRNNPQGGGGRPGGMGGGHMGGTTTHTSHSGTTHGGGGFSF
ncbi:MAG: TPM domain-containing protein [Lachnospiraceae bacterium]|nr:TPM domain-containing protein [Lachnospiraceae bacterium]